MAAELTAAGLSPQPLAWRVDAFTVPGEQRRALTRTAAFREARLCIQNPSSWLPPEALAPREGDWILDLAAAPGGKALHLAGLIRNRGRISAVEPVRSRFFRLRRTLQDGGATCVQLYCRDGAGVGRDCPERFDRVLLDAPCSGEGRFRVAAPETFRHWSARRIGALVRTQGRLLASAAEALKVGGVLVYATCTLAPEENEVVLDRMLRRHGDALELEPVASPVPNALPGLTAWGRRDLHPGLSRALRVVPDGLMEGFFLARLRKRRSLEEDAP